MEQAPVNTSYIVFGAEISAPMLSLKVLFSSKSITSTLLFVIFLNAFAISTVQVLFPTPPFADVIAIVD